MGGEEIVGEIIATGLALDKNRIVSKKMKNRMIFEDNAEDE